MGALYDEVSELALHNCYDKFLTTGTAHGCMYRLNIQPQDRLSGKTKTKKSKKCACIYQLYCTPFIFLCGKHIKNYSIFSTALVMLQFFTKSQGIPCIVTKERCKKGCRGIHTLHSASIENYEIRQLMYRRTEGVSRIGLCLKIKTLGNFCARR
jgi:hypothetical protein